MDALEIYKISHHLSGGIVRVSRPAGLVQRVHHADHLLASDTHAVDTQRHHHDREGQGDHDAEWLTSSWDQSIVSMVTLDEDDLTQ